MRAHLLDAARARENWFSPYLIASQRANTGGSSQLDLFEDFYRNRAGDALKPHLHNQPDPDALCSPCSCKLGNGLRILRAEGVNKRYGRACPAVVFRAL